MPASVPPTPRPRKCLTEAEWKEGVEGVEGVGILVPPKYFSTLDMTRQSNR